jgi:hypothetical protein
MAKRPKFGAKCSTVSLGRYINWPRRLKAGEWWRKLRERVRAYPEGKQTSWGVPFAMAKGTGPRVVLVADGDEVTVPLKGRADFVCVLHEWRQLPGSHNRKDPTEGLVVGEYVLTYAGGVTAVLPIRARFEVAMDESPGPPWLALPFNKRKAIDPMKYPEGWDWGGAQTGVGGNNGVPMICALPNPHPKKMIRSLTVRSCVSSPLILAGVTLYRGASHPLRHLPRRTYRVKTNDKTRVEKADVDLGTVVRVERTDGPRGAGWLKSKDAGVSIPAHRYVRSGTDRGEDLVEAVGSEDATLSVKLEGKKKPLNFSLGDAFHNGKDKSGRATLQVLGQKRQWMTVRVLDRATEQPTPVRIHISGSRGEYIAPYGHHSVINTGWFMDYGADVVSAGRNYAYVTGEVTSDLPVGDLYIDIYKGFEYEPVRKKVTVRPGQRTLTLSVGRKRDWRSQGWVTADTHVHFISPHTAWLEGQCEGVNVINLLASQWGRLFTNVGDVTGRVGVVEDDTIVYVGTENRNHMLGHMSMLGTKGPLPVYPMCCGGPGEADIGDPDFRLLAEWAIENKRKGGVVIRPHYPFCGHTEDPVPIIKGLVDALEIRGPQENDFSTQEWYRYLNCGYRVAVCGGTDKMGAYCPLGWTRTYAKLDPTRPFTYENWAKAVRAGRTFSSTGPLIDLAVEGQPIGSAIKMPATGGTVEVEARADSFHPLSKLEIVCNGRAVAVTKTKKGSQSLRLHAHVPVTGSGWIAARCIGAPNQPGSYVAAHTSPVYLKCGQTRAFDGPAAEHMLALVEGGTEYLNTLATHFDESSRKRMVKLFKEVQRELKGRLVVEGNHAHHHGPGGHEAAGYHTHGHSHTPDHQH